MRDIISLSRIVQGKNPRDYFDPQEMAELQESIRTYGVLQPILVRPCKDSNLFEIIAGERRWRAAKNVFGDDYDMPVVILNVGDIDAAAIAMIENYHRADISVAEEAKGAQSLLYRNGGDKEETARQLGWSLPLLERRLALLACTPAVLKALIERRILIGHAELLAGVPAATQDKVLDGVIAHKVPVLVLKKQLGQFARRLADVVFDTAQCNACVHNSARQAELFAESIGEGYCQHPRHFDELTMQVIEAKAAGLKEEYQVVKIVKASDGFMPLPLMADGALGVGSRNIFPAKDVNRSAAPSPPCRGHMANSPNRCVSMRSAMPTRSPCSARQNGKHCIRPLQHTVRTRAPEKATRRPPANQQAKSCPTNRSPRTNRRNA